MNADIVLIECPGEARVVLVGGVLVYAEDPAEIGCFNDTYDADWIAETLARVLGNVPVHRVQLPADFTVMDEDGPSHRWTFNHVRDWWIGMCEAEEASRESLPPVYPTLSEQLLGVIEYAGVQPTEELRRLVADLERAVRRAG